MINWIYFFVVVIVALYASKSDISNHIVSNKYIAIVFLSFIIYNLISGYFYDFPMLKNYMINIVSCMLISITLFLTRLWGAGDAKYAIALSASIPCNAFYNYNISFPVIYALIYSFALGYVFLVFQSVCLLIKKEQSFSQKVDLDTVSNFIFSYIRNTVYVYFVIIIFTLFLGNKMGNYSYVLYAFETAVLMNVSKVKSKYVPYIIVIIDVIGCILLNINIAPTVPSLIFVLGLTILGHFISKYNYRTIQINELKKGMIISARSAALFINSKTKDLPLYFSEDYDARMSDANIDSVKRWSQSTGITTIVILNKVPFAPFISLGFIIVIAIGVLI